jgi:hypothetical protein
VRVTKLSDDGRIQSSEAIFVGTVETHLPAASRHAFSAASQS